MKRRPLTAREIHERNRMPLYTHEEIASTALPAEECAGIYFLVRGNKVVYVGQSTNVYKRLGDHFSDKYKNFDRIAIIHCDVNELNYWESRYIKAMRPEHNGTRWRTRLSVNEETAAMLAGFEAQEPREVEAANRTEKEIA